MRTIKFRAWDKENNTMIPSEAMAALIWTQGDEPNWIQYNFGSGMEQVHYSNFELMQFTGLQDKNGKDIYEGDIVSDGTLGFVMFDRGRFQPHYIGESGDIQEEWEDDFYLRVDGCEVLGNEFENPELLGKQD